MTQQTDRQLSAAQSERATTRVLSDSLERSAAAAFDIDIDAFAFDDSDCDLVRDAIARSRATQCDDEQTAFDATLRRYHARESNRAFVSRDSAFDY